jgi:hypothetical protein
MTNPKLPSPPDIMLERFDMQQGGGRTNLHPQLRSP